MAVPDRLLAGLLLIFVHGPEGQEIEINVAEISSIRQPREKSDDHFARDTQCIIYMSNGHFISTVENCSDVVLKIAEIGK